MGARSGGHIAEKLISRGQGPGLRSAPSPPYSTPTTPPGWMGLADEEGEGGGLWKTQCWPGVCYSSNDCELSTYYVLVLLRALGQRNVHSKGPVPLGLTCSKGSVDGEGLACCFPCGAVREGLSEEVTPEQSPEAGTGKGAMRHLGEDQPQRERLAPWWE